MSNNEKLKAKLLLKHLLEEVEKDETIVKRVAYGKSSSYIKREVGDTGEMVKMRTGDKAVNLEISLYSSKNDDRL